MLRSFSFSGGERRDRDRRPSSSSSRPGTPIQRIWRYLSTTDLPTYKRPALGPITIAQVVDDGHNLGLGNPNILKHIFNHLDTPDLLRLRRVNLRWNHISCEYLRNRLGPCRLRPSKIKQFFKLMKRNFCSPFGSFAIRIENLGDLQIKHFFRMFSQDIIKLRVKIASDEIPDFFNRILDKLPNLEVLHILRIPEGKVFIRAEYITPSAWVYGVYLFPKLKSIILESDDPSVPFLRNYDKILSQVVNSSPNLVKISFINWDSHFARLISRCGISNPKSFDGWKFTNTSNPNLKEDLIELFYEHRMKFKALKFSLDDKIPFDLIMEMTLQTSEHLYHFALKNERPLQPFQCSLQLRRLITLGLQGWRGPVHFTGMDKQFPYLKSLKISPCNFSQENGPLPIIGNLETLTIMPLEGTENDPVGPKLMAKLVKMFPNLKELYAQVEQNETLHLVYKEWPKLTLLWIDLRGDDIGDLSMTGVPPEFVVINGQWECGCSHVTVKDEERWETNIGSLRELKTLILRAGCLSDVSLFEGISNLEGLETLWLLPAFEVQRKESSEQDIRFHQMPKPWCLRAIADCFKHLKHLVTSSEVVYSQDDLSYLRERLPELVHECKL